MKTRVMVNIGILFLAAACFFPKDCWASSDKAVFVSGLVWRGDGEGDWTFKGKSKLKGTGIAEDGAVEYLDSPGTYEISTPYRTESEIYSVSANWLFSGKVTLEVSTTGSSNDYVSVVNGVPLEYGKFVSGKKLIWKATLAPDSKLTEVRITYTDISGVVGSFGTPQLSGFMFRKPIYIRGQGSEKQKPNPESRILNPDSGVFHYQIPIRVGESANVSNCDFNLKGVVQADFADVRFTQADQQTLLPYYLEDAAGNKPNRTATFWVRIPHIPLQGLLIYLYYGNADAEDLSDAEAVFDFFDDFRGETLDADKWTSALESDIGYIEVSDSLLRLDDAKITSAAYKIQDAIIEYKAESNGGAIVGIIGKKAPGHFSCYSSASKDAEHCIAEGIQVKVNDPKPISLTSFYNYRVTTKGPDFVFERYDEDWVQQEAKVEYSDTDVFSEGYIGLSTAGKGMGAYYDWIRTRRLVVPAPEVDVSKTAHAQEEVPNIPQFQDVTVGLNGDLILSGSKTEGEYISQLIHSAFQARIIVPGWVQGTGGRGQGAGKQKQKQKKPNPEPRTPNPGVSIDISAKEYELFKQDCRNGEYYYASKKDFTEGNSLRWRARFSSGDNKGQGTGGRGRKKPNPEPRTPNPTENPVLKRVSIDFRPGAISIVLPNGGENLAVGSQYAIVWDASDYEPSYKIKLEYSINRGRDFQTIAEAADNSGRYSWIVPDKVSDKVVVKVSDTLDKNIYDVLNNYCSIVRTAPDEEKEQEAGDREQGSEEELTPGSPAQTPEPFSLTPEEEELEKGQRPGTKLYDLLIKVGDRVSVDPAENIRTYKEGDIVMIKPAGHKWGAAELEKFVIVQAYLTPAEARDLMQPGKAVDGTIIRRRKHKVDLGKRGLSARVSAMQQILRSRPLVDIEAIEEK